VAGFAEGFASAIESLLLFKLNKQNVPIVLEVGNPSCEPCLGLETRHNSFRSLGIVLSIDDIVRRAGNVIACGLLPQGRLDASPDTESMGSLEYQEY